MRHQSPFHNSTLSTLAVAAAVTWLVLLATLPAQAQSAVPPTARQAGASPAFASKLHPATPAATNKPRAAAPVRSGRTSPQNQASCSDGPWPQCDEWMYDNGPVNGNDNAWPICCGYVVSNSFVMQYPGYIGWVYFYIWKLPGDVLSSVQWSITSAPNGGTVYGSGTATYGLGDDYILTNQYGYDVDIVSIDMFLSGLSSGTYWINLFNASTLSGNPVSWDQNSGAGCQAYGCPSQAYDNAYGQIPSEAFDIGNNDAQPTPCFQAGPNLQVIHDFTAQEIGANGLISDKAGNLYGTTGSGGVNGAGLAYELSNKGQGWVLNPLYSFLGGSNGSGPSPLIVGPDAVLYGTATGGIQNCQYGTYCGLVYSLRPGPTACLTALCSWTENTPYKFANDASAGGIAAFDQAGNLYGFSGYGNGANGWGAIFELTPLPGGWTEKILYSFTSDDAYPSSLLVGNDGALYGTTVDQYWGNYNRGVVFQLAPSGDSWTRKVIYDFNGKGSDGPNHLVQDSQGNFYGVANREDQYGDGYAFTVFKLSPSNGGWVFSQLYQSQGWMVRSYPGTSGLAIDAAGNLYLAITDYCSGREGSCSGDGIDGSWGLVVMVSPDGNASNLWYSHGVDFSVSGPLAVDANGSVYGTTSDCGANNAGTVWKATP